jgi:hypothetical protein
LAAAGVHREPDQEEKVPRVLGVLGVLGVLRVPE